jgi:transposase
MLSLMALSSRSTRGRPAQKGDTASGHWALARWANDKDRRVGGCARQFGSVSAAAIPPKTNRKIQRNYDAEVYKWRHLVENYFAMIKEFRGIATRYEKTDCSFTACWNLVAALIASR